MPRPTLPKAARRVHITCRVAPETKRIIDRLARSCDSGGIGEALDRLAAFAATCAANPHIAITLANAGIENPAH